MIVLIMKITHKMTDFQFDVKLKLECKANLVDLLFHVLK